MKLPLWLYRDYATAGLRVRRFGSRRPLRLVLTVVDGDSDWLAPGVLLGVGPFGIQWGPAAAVHAGHCGLPRGSRARLIYPPAAFPIPVGPGKAVGLSWDGTGW